MIDSEIEEILKHFDYELTMFVERIKHTLSMIKDEQQKC
jgi:hypothetical protein